MKIRVFVWLPLTATLFLSWIVPVVHALPNEILIAQMSAKDYIKQGIARNNLKDYKGAIEDYTQAIRLEPNNANAYSLRAIARDDLKDYKGAIEDYTQAIRLKLDNANEYFLRGHARYLLKDYQRAGEDYQKAADLSLAKGDMSHYQIALNLQSMLRGQAPHGAEPYPKTPLSKNFEKQVSSGNLTREEAVALGKTPINISSYNSGATTTPYIKIISNNDLRYDGDYVIGSVTNVGTKTARFVKINFQIYNDSKTLIDIGSAFTEPTDLAPGQTGFFKGVSLKSGSSVRTMIEWNKTLSQ